MFYFLNLHGNTELATLKTYNGQELDIFKSKSRMRESSHQQ